MTNWEELNARGLVKDVAGAGIEEVINNGGKNFYWGTDPTADSLHLGHYSSLVTAKRLMMMGHRPILLCGGATGRIGDPRPTSEREIISIDILNKNESLEGRKASGIVLNEISKQLLNFTGGNADLVASTKANIDDGERFSVQNRTGRNICFGVREHAMGSILNGMALSGLRVFGSTFLTFSDYLKPAIRMSALMHLPVTYIFTHDSVRIGEDGPTHQPIEQLAMLRTIPNLVVFRPVDINEVIGCWDFIVNNKRPVALVLAKEEAHILDGTSGEKVKRGAYVVRKERERLDAVLISTGIDFTTTYLISEELRAKGIDTRLVSMPSVDLFLNESKEYQDSVIPPNTKVFTIEASATLPWYRFASKDCAIGINTFGRKDDVLQYVGFDYESILNKIETRIRNN